MCSLHFRKEDFQTESTDSNKRSQKKKGTAILQKRYLKPTAIPSIFPNCPTYFNKKIPDERGEKSLAESRRAVEGERLEKAAEKFLQEDAISNIEELCEKAAKEVLPQNTTMIRDGEKVVFMSIACTDDKKVKILYSLIVYKDLSFAMQGAKDKRVSLSQVHHICSGKQLETMSQVSNIVAFLKNQSGPTEPDSLQDYIKEFKANISNVDLDSTTSRKISFAIEQMEMANQRPKGRRYSTALLSVCVLWERTSPALYKQILGEDLLCYHQEDDQEAKEYERDNPYQYIFMGGQDTLSKLHQDAGGLLISIAPIVGKKEVVLVHRKDGPTCFYHLAAQLDQVDLSIPDLLQAQYLARQQQDRDDFHQRLTGIINAPDDLMPELGLQNQIGVASRACDEDHPVANAQRVASC